MALSVVRSRETMVKPCDKTPSGRLELSAVDKVPVLRFNTRTLHVYQSRGEEAYEAIREALSRALVPYYPLAGRLRCDAGEIFIECCGEGVFLVEAAAECTLKSLKDLDSNHLLPHSHHHDAPFLQMQVTQFACGGFVMGVIFSHTICDGLGAAQFLKAVGEYATGSKQLSLQPVWCRDFLVAPPPQPLTTALPLPMPEYKLVKANMDVSTDQINKLKCQFQEETGQRCSSFEIIVAGLWRCRTRAIAGADSTVTKLVFFVNCRKLVEPPLAEGFYGNCIFPTSVTAPKEWMGGASLREVVKVIQRAKAEVPRKFGEYCRRSRESVAARDEPFMAALSYEVLYVSEWGRLGFKELEMVAGSGRAVEIVAVQEEETGIPGVIVDERAGGVRLMSCCVQSQHQRLFLHHLSQLFSS